MQKAPAVWGVLAGRVRWAGCWPQDGAMFAGRLAGARRL